MMQDVQSDKQTLLRQQSTCHLLVTFMIEIYFGSTILKISREKVRTRGANFTSNLTPGARHPRYAPGPTSTTTLVHTSVKANQRHVQA